MGEVSDARRSYCRSPEDCLMAGKDAGRCAVCKTRATARSVQRRRLDPNKYRRWGGVPITAKTVPAYVDDDFDDMGE